MVGPDGRPLAFEILLNGNAGDQIAMAWQRTLAKLGVAASIRSVDAAQYQQRISTFDFDVIAAELSPRRCRPAPSRSAAGARPRATSTAPTISPASPIPAVDGMIARSARRAQRKTFRHRRTRLRPGAALRLLCGAALSSAGQWVARWKDYEHPEKTSLYGYQFPTWWKRP